MQKERADRRAEAEAVEAARRLAEREEKRRAALAYQPADWIRSSEAEDGTGEGAGEEEEEEEEVRFVVCAWPGSVRCATPRWCGGAE